MKNIQKILIGSMALALVMTFAATQDTMASSAKVTGKYVTAKNDKAKTNSSTKQSEQKSQKEQKKKQRDAEKAAVKATYSDDELSKLKVAGDKIKKNNKNISVLPVENIIVKGAKVKFDTPPVIKSGRTLIPVKAISEAFGAKVQWISAERKVVITKDNTEIVLQLDNNKIYVNGVESTIDVPACSVNGRTVVPLKFIVEKLGLLVKWDSDSQVVDIENPTTGTTPDTTTGTTPGTTTGTTPDTTTGTTPDTTTETTPGTTTGTTPDTTTGTTPDTTTGTTPDTTTGTTTGTTPSTTTGTTPDTTTGTTPDTTTGTTSGTTTEVQPAQ